MKGIHVMRNIEDYIYGFDVNLNNDIFKNEKINIPEELAQLAIDEYSFKLNNLERIPFIAPTISPGLVSSEIDYLEHPMEIFKEYKKKGCNKIIGELKHMGSRAIICIFKNEEIAYEYTGHKDKIYIYSRRGYKFFNDNIVIDKLQKLLDETNYFSTYNIDFEIWDCEILPWNIKGQGLLNQEYIPVITAANSLYNKLNKLQNPELRKSMIEYFNKTTNNIEQFKKQLNNYCWDCDINNIKIAPFHVLANNKGTYFTYSHIDHLNHFDILKENNDFIIDTPYVIVDLNNEKSMNEAIDFWKDITSKGYEGLMFKTFNFIEFDKDELIIPMLKCRGKEYLRIIYGINYDMQGIINEYKKRHTSLKRKKHIQQTKLGIESLNRFIKKEDFFDCILGSMALNYNQNDIRL